ncbi:MAG TPA: MerR family transcriptional regulator [Mariniphaga sp.]|nr:MerR family transcriptional regulator [Mariniphaga sp.]
MVVTNKKQIEKIFFTIGEVAQLLGVTPSSIRYWENNFDDLKPQKSSGGTRLFSKDDIETLKLINYLVKERGLTIKGARLKLKQNRSDTVNTWEIVKRLQTVREKLVDIKNGME